ncbi:CAZyme family GH18 [Penicillium longicatenatum]|uniref:CAZyme family GH18 n=1 Tax=Penicillium longicatenatum TaxID=1561947 RepID=UPI0025473849|nr:CAZyme family GH18 [Penicillium longicatenatum]KAJ5635474.1 CAZyme family GH18 [Penicillium longicatenatum]
MKTAIGAFVPFLSLNFLITLPSLTHASPNKLASSGVLPAPGCPEFCLVVGSNPSNWTWIPILFDYHIDRDSSSNLVVRSCAILEPFPE